MPFYLSEAKLERVPSKSKWKKWISLAGEYLTLASVQEQVKKHFRGKPGSFNGIWSTLELNEGPPKPPEDKSTPSLPAATAPSLTG